MSIGRLAGGLLLAISLGAGTARAIPPERPPAPDLKLPLQPGGFGYRMVDALPGITFDQPLALVTPPGETNRLFVVEKTGRIQVVTNLTAPTKTLFLSLTANLLTSSEQGLLGLAFHPDYANNGRFFVFRTPRTGPSGTLSAYNVLSEFRVDPTNPHRGDPTSEIPIFRQRDEASNHNGGDLHFGPDGYLYVALGDEGAGNDAYNNSQRIDRELFAGVLRIDVDKRPGSLAPNRNESSPAEVFAYTTNYAIPADNPFVGATSFNGRAVDPTRVRTEFWAVGLRNPWRMSFDRATGELWIGDVGQDRQEMVFISRAGANHGWAYREGSLAGPKWNQAPAGFLTNPDFHHVPPLHGYGHGSGPTQGNSITGGLVYRGSRLGQLFGAYVFADYVSGNVWALRRGGTTPVVTRLTGSSGIAGFGTDPSNGDVLAANLNNGRILRLTYNDTFTGAPLPATLAETGAFADTDTLTPVPGLIPYEINLPFWSDNAIKRRWFSVPDGTTIGFTADDSWTTPVGTVWVKHFDIEMVKGDPASLRRLETRFLVRNNAGVYGVTYRWQPDGTATLVPEEGAVEELHIREDDVVWIQPWEYPSRAACVLCHNPAAGGSLSFSTAQLHREITRPDGTVVSQLDALRSAGYLPPGEPPGPLRPHATPDDESASLESRARSYLTANCSSCHRPGGPGGGRFDTRLHVPTALTGLLDPDTPPGPGPGPRRPLIAPGVPDNSRLLHRMSIRGPAQMPPIASSLPDPSGVDLLTRWIQALGGRVTYADWLATELGPIANPDQPIQTDTDDDGAPDFLEYLVGTRAADPSSTWQPVLRQLPDGPTIGFRQPANVGYRIHVSDDPVAGRWLPWTPPGGLLDFPAAGRDVEIPLPAGEAARFHRVELLTP